MSFQPDEDAIEHAITAANLLDTTVHLCVRSCELAAQTGGLDEFDRHAEHVAHCLVQPSSTRHLARDFMEVVALNARRRVGADVDLSAEQYVDALHLVGDFCARVLERMPVSV